MQDKIGQLRAWHCPQIPCKPFYVYVESPQDAQRVLQVLAKYDLFQLENKIKPDFRNAGGLEVYTDDCDGEGTAGWSEWYDEETGDDIDEWTCA